MRGKTQKEKWPSEEKPRTKSDRVSEELNGFRVLEVDEDEGIEEVACVRAVEGIMS